MMRLLLWVFFLVVAQEVARGFIVASSRQYQRRLLLWSELRDLGCLPFDREEILLPGTPYSCRLSCQKGDSRYLHLYESRFLALFEFATEERNSTVALGFFTDDGVSVTFSSSKTVNRRC